MNFYSPNGHRRLNNFGNSTFNYVVGSYNPNECDVQYDLVRVQNSTFNPWTPIKEEVWTSYYNKEDPWGAERQKEMRMNNEIRVNNDPSVYHNLRGVVGNNNNLRNGMNSNNQRVVVNQVPQTNGTPQLRPDQIKLFQNRLMSQQISQPDMPLNLPPPSMASYIPPAELQELPFRTTDERTFFNLPSTCSSCVENNGDCKDNLDGMQYCFSPACSTMRECRDYSNRAGKRTWAVVTAPI